MGVKLYNTHKDFLQQEWKIEVIDTSFSGTPIEFRCDYQGATIEWDGEDKNIITDGLRPSMCSFGIIVSAQDTELNTYLESVVLYSEQKLFLNLYKKVSGNYVLVWKGLVNQTGFEFPEEADYTFTMTANDGFARLKDQPFNYILTASDNVTLMEVLSNALSYNGIYDQVGSSDVWISSALELFARNQRTTRDVLFDSRVRRESFYEDLDSLTPMNCYDVIESIIKSFGAQLKMWDGRYYIYRAVDLRLTFINVKNYTKTGTYINSTTIAPALTFPVANTRYAFNPIQYTFDQAYKRVNVNWNAVSKFESFKRVPIPYNTDNIEITINDAAVARSTYKMTSDINVYYTSRRGITQSGNGSSINASRNNGASSKSDSFHRVFYVIQSDNYFLKLTSNGAIWVWQPSDKSVFFDQKWDFSTITKIHNELLFPPPPTGSTNIYVKIYVVALDGVIMPFNGILTLEQQVNSPIGQNPLTYINDNSEPKYEDEKKVYQDNENTGALNVISTTQIKISDEPFLAQSCLRVYDGTNWNIPNQWKQGSSDTQPLPFTKMYARELMRAYKNPLYKCTGVFFMDVLFNVMKTITWRGRVLFFNAGKFSTATNEWDGEFVQISYNTNNKPISATKPTVETFDRRIINEIGLIKASIKSLTGNLDGINNTIISLTDNVSKINQTRSLNADKYLIDNVEGIPEAGADIGSQWPLKAEVTSTGVKLKFFST